MSRSTYKKKDCPYCLDFDNHGFETPRPAFVKCEETFCSPKVVLCWRCARELKNHVENAEAESEYFDNFE